MNRLKEKTFVIIAIIGLALPTMAVLGYNIYFDPFQIFHKDLTKPTVLLGGRGTDRYQQAGIINQYNISSAIIGHSHSANYLPSKIKKEFGWDNVYSLTMDGLSLNEQSVVAKRLLQKHTIKNIQWGFSVNNLLAPWDKSNKELHLKRFLYDNNRFNDLKFFLTLDLYKYVILKQNKQKHIVSTGRLPFQQKLEFDEATSWYKKRQCDFNRPAFVASKILGKNQFTYNKIISKSLLLPLDHNEFQNHSIKPETITKNFQDNLSHNLLPIIVQNQQTMFNIIITPRPTLWLQNLKAVNKKRYITYLQTIKKLVIKTQQYPNVKIFAFNLEKFTDDLRLYKDSSHFHIEVNNYLIEKMAKGEGMLTETSVELYIQSLDRKVSNFRLPVNWRPKDNNKEKGYLSLETARLLITSDDISDEKVSALFRTDTILPKCAKKMLENCNQ